jgi:hypothetical protein
MLDRFQAELVVQAGWVALAVLVDRVAAVAAVVVAVQHLELQADKAAQEQQVALILVAVRGKLARALVLVMVQLVAVLAAYIQTALLVV